MVTIGSKLATVQDRLRRIVEQQHSTTTVIGTASKTLCRCTCEELSLHRLFGYERVYLPLHKVADLYTPYYPRRRHTMIDHGN